MLVPLATEHPTLAATAAGLVDLLRDWRGVVSPASGGSVWMQHLEFAERTEQLSDQLAAILALADADRFSSALALARTGLEHHLLDRLLLLSDRYEEVVTPHDPALLDEWERDWKEGTEPWTQGVVSVDRTKRGNALRIIRKGHDVRNREGEVAERVSPYWRIFEHYDAFVGHPELQQSVNHPFRPTDERRERAERNQRIYSEFVKWRSIHSNLRLSELVSEIEAIQLEVHYSFLSAFTHATKSAYEIGRVPPPGPASTPHLLGELAILYVSTIAINEIATWERFTQNRPHLLAPLPSGTTDAAAAADEMTAYFWFLGGAPQPFDIVQEANRRAAPLVLAHRPNDINPSDIPAAEVTYYPNPFDRLAWMHAGGGELTTGFGYPPAWSTLHW